LRIRITTPLSAASEAFILHTYTASRIYGVTSKSLLLIVVLSLVLIVYPVLAAATYVPTQGDYFNYHEVESLGSGTGNYAGYTEQTVVDGKETMNSVDANGLVSATYGYSWTFTNSSGSAETGSQSGSYTFSSADYYYNNGTDDQTGYINPTVWFLMDNSIPKGGTFTLLNTEMTVESTSYSYYLPSQNRNVNSIFAQGTSSYERNDVYGQFNAEYTWKAYFDPTTGYIIGYEYVEHDTNSSGDGFTWTDTLYVTSNSYSLTAATSGSGGANSSVILNVELIATIVLVIVAIIIIIIALSRKSRRLPKHSPSREYSPLPSPPPAPQIDLTTKQPLVQQIVIKEVVKVKCRYCGALIDSTAQTCPYCGAPRT